MLLAPLWFALVIIIAGVLTPNYTHLLQAISELGAPGAPLAPLVNLAGFLPLGCAMMFFAFAAPRFLASQAQKAAVAILFGLAGAAIIIAGLFPTDPGGRRDTLVGVIHAVAGISLLIVAGLTPLVIGALPAPGKKNTAFRCYSLITGAVLVTLFMLTPNGLLPELIAWQRQLLGALFPLWYKYYGIHQRLFMLIYFTWTAVFAWLFIED